MISLMLQTKVKQQYYHFEEWEDFKNGMYATTCLKTDKCLKKAVLLLSNPYLCEKYMQKAVSIWQKSALHNLSNYSRNRRAWLGQAACCFFSGTPEYLTKQAWWLLTDKQRDKANHIADQVIRKWEKELILSSQLCLKLF